MVTMNISLPDDMKAFVDEEVRTRGFMSSSEYVRDLIRQQREEISVLREKVLAGINSGTPLPAQDVAARLRAKVDAFAAKSK
jgi:antitoxin ParD1/3/4